MPAQITLRDLAGMAGADENHRYELSPEGVLSVMPPADPEHALIVSRLFAWFLTNGFGPDQVVTDCGIDVGGGRVPDLTIWAPDRPPRAVRSSYAGIAGLLIVIEVVSSGSEVIDQIVKKVEYANAGIGRYWVVERGSATAVVQYELDPANGEYRRASEHPMSWLLASSFQ